MAETSSDRFHHVLGLLITLIAWGAVVYHMSATQILFMSSIEHQIVHLFLVLSLITLSAAYTAQRFSVRLFWLILAVVSILTTGYIYYFYEHLEEVIGFPEQLDVIVGVSLVVVVIVCTWKSWGKTFPIITVVCILYFFLGHLLPQPFYHPKFDFSMVVGYLSISFRGIFGPFLAFMANFGFLLVFFGALLEVMGANQFFLEVGKLGGRVTRAGQAHTAVIGSSFVGMASGSAIGNVIITGSFTIPTMKKSGYQPATAGAIEAVASTGSQIMPPIMGSAVFLMAGFLGKPYAEIMIAGVIPAILYYWGVGLGVELWARRRDIHPPKVDVDMQIIYSRFLSFVVPLGVLTGLLINHYSAGMASFWAILLVLFFGLIQKSTRPNLKQFSEGLTKGVLGAVKITIVIAAVAMIAQTFISTGLGQKVAYVVQTLSGGNIYLMLIITMILSIILGCGMPTMAAYALMAILVAPALVQVGLGMFEAHFFCFYFAIMAAVTPPVALASLAAAGIAEADYYKTSLRAFMFALPGFVIPYFWVFNPSILLMFQGTNKPFLSIIAAFLSITCLIITVLGYLFRRLGILQRGVFLAATVFFSGVVFTQSEYLFYLSVTVFLAGVVLNALASKIIKEKAVG